jgi:uncharacterized protein
MTVCVDANCIIYLVEQNPVWCLKIVDRLATLRQAGAEIAASDLARTECLTQPLARGNAALIVDYQRFFGGNQVRMLPRTASVCEQAARIRAASNFHLKVPDCLHLAAAVEHGCGLFLTNDADLTRCAAIAIEVLS